MCLYVSDSFVKTPIFEQECIKVLAFEGGNWYTPYQDIIVPTNGTGWFMPKHLSQRKREFAVFGDRSVSGDTVIHGGFIHAYQSLFEAGFHKAYSKLPKKPRDSDEYAFRAIARYVVAYERDQELACKAIYIPAFDATRVHRDAQLILK